MPSMQRILSLSLGAGLVFCILILPNHPGTMKWSAFNRWPLELPVILLTMIAIGRFRGLASVFAIALVAVAFMKLADYGTFIAYNRTFNPVLDFYLVNAGLGLLRDTLGGPQTIALILGFAVAVVALFFALRHGLKAWAALPFNGWTRGIAAVGVLATGSWAVADAGHHLKYWRFDKSPPGTAWTTRLSFKRGVEMQATVADLVEFRRDARDDRMSGLTGAFDRLDGRDVYLFWIESYGRASFDNPLYADTHLTTLAKAETAIRDAGMHIRSGWLTSPTAGGQSWLAHGSLASGLWTSNHGRYNAMIASGREWLFHHAQRAGYRTSVFMPAITLAWPESLFMGFENVFPAAEIPYKGERFNWVTMPDQFTLATYQGMLEPDPRPDFIQVALISSHAPWTPVPDLLPWDQIGDGTEFNEMAARGPTPRELWKNRDNVRDAYRRSIDYSLEAVFSHVAQLGDDAPLIIVAGDHQAAGFVAGSDNHDVAVHFVGPAEVLDMIDHWDWTDSLVPASDGPVRRMDTFRDDFLTAFSSSLNQLTEADQ